MCSERTSSFHLETLYLFFWKIISCAQWTWGLVGGTRRDEPAGIFGVGSICCHLSRGGSQILVLQITAKQIRGREVRPDLTVQHLQCWLKCCIGCGIIQCFLSSERLWDCVWNVQYFKWDQTFPASHISHITTLHLIRAGYFNFSSAVMNLLWMVPPVHLHKKESLVQQEFDRRFSPCFLDWPTF